MKYSAELFVLVLVLAGAAGQSEARVRALDVHEPLPQATMIEPSLPEAPVAPVQATVTDGALDAPVSLAPDDTQAAPLEPTCRDASRVAVAATPADPLFIPGTRLAIVVSPAVAVTAAVPAAQPGPLAAPTAPARPGPLNRFQLRRRAITRK